MCALLFLKHSHCRFFNFKNLFFAYISHRYFQYERMDIKLLLAFFTSLFKRIQPMLNFVHIFIDERKNGDDCGDK